MAEERGLLPSSRHASLGTSVSTELDNVPRSLDNVRKGVAMLGGKSIAALGLQSVLQPMPEVFRALSAG